MTGLGSPGNRRVHPQSAEVTVELAGSMQLHDDADAQLIWTTWDAKLCYSGELLAEDLGVEGGLPDLMLAEATLGSVAFDRLEEADIPLAEALDAYSGDYEEFCCMADHYGIADDLQQALETYAAGMVVLDRVTVPAPFRGRRYGLLLATVVLMELGRQRVAVALPAAFEVGPGSPGRQAADDRNAQLWTAFGFRRYRQEKVYFLDTATRTLQDNLRRFGREVDEAEPIPLP